MAILHKIIYNRYMCDVYMHLCFSFFLAARLVRNHYTVDPHCRIESIKHILPIL